MVNITRRTALMTMGAAAAAAATPRLAFAADGDTINLAMIAPLTGPYAFTGQRELAGWQDAIDHFNGQGGAGGRMLKLLALDSEYKVDVGVAQWKKAIAEGPVHFAKADSIPLARAMAPENNDRYKMLLGTTANGSHLTAAEGFNYFFIPAPTYSGLMSIAFNQIQKMAGAGSKPKVALIHSNIEFGRDPIPYALARAKELGFDLVLEDETAMTGVDVTASAVKLRQAKPDFMIFHGYAGNVWPDILKLSRDYSVEAQAMGTIWAVDPDTVKGIGSAADGFIGIVPHTLQIKGDDRPLIKAVDGYLTKRDPNYPGYGGIGYMSGWAFVALLREFFDRAIKAGGPLDGPSLIAAAETLKDWDFGRRLRRPRHLQGPEHPVRFRLQIQCRRQRREAAGPGRRRARRRLHRNRSAAGRAAGPAIALPGRSMSDNILEISDLHVGYSGGITGLAGLSLTVQEGKIVALLGANGAGKSTTLKAVSNLLPFEGGRIVSGSIRFKGKEIGRVPAYRLSRLGLLHVREGRRVFASMTVHDNLVAATYALTGRSEPRLQQRCDDIYDLFPHLARRKSLLAGYLSGGEQQMLAIGRALVGEPQLMLIDEASLGLAPVIAADIFRIISLINRQRGISVLIVEQNAMLALHHSEHAYVLDNGRSVLDGPSAELRESPLVTERYLGGAATEDQPSGAAANA